MIVAHSDGWTLSSINVSIPLLSAVKLVAVIRCLQIPKVNYSLSEIVRPFVCSKLHYANVATVFLPFICIFPPLQMCTDETVQK